jgi:hypothetical protein
MEIKGQSKAGTTAQFDTCKKYGIEPLSADQGGFLATFLDRNCLFLFVKRVCRLSISVNARIGDTYGNCSKELPLAGQTH